MSLVRSALLLAFAVGAVSVVGCSSQTSPTSLGNSTGIANNTGVVGASSGTGTVTLELQLSPGITLSTVAYTITNPSLPGFTTTTGSVDVSGSQTVGFSLTLPVASGYSLSLTATDSNGDGCASGPATFSVLAGQSNTVALTLTCSETIDGGVNAPDVNVGTVVVIADASLEATVVGSSCAAATSLVASPNETTVGSAIALTGAGIDPSYQSSDVTLTWTSTGGFGSLSATTGTSTTFACTAAGTETVTMTAAISDGGASCPNVGSLTVILRCDPAVDASTADASVAEASVAETGASETGTAETGSGGPPTPCTTAPCAASGPNSVQCAASPNGVCTATEALIVAHDILKNGQGPGVNTNGSCYTCLVVNACIDSTGASGPGPTGNGSGEAVLDAECGDPNGSSANAPFTNPNASTSDPSACLSALACVLTSNGANPSSECSLSQLPASVSNCFCGSDTGSTCLSAQNGVCVSIIESTLGTTNPTTVLEHFTDTTFSAGGVGLAILNCGLTAPASPPAAAKCPTCFN